MYIVESLPVVMIPDTADAAVVSAAATAGPPMLLEIDQVSVSTLITQQSNTFLRTVGSLLILSMSVICFPTRLIYWYDIALD